MATKATAVKSTAISPWVWLPLLVPPFFIGTTIAKDRIQPYEQLFHVNSLCDGVGLWLISAPLSMLSAHIHRNMPSATHKLLNRQIKPMLATSSIV
jgi:hypothetical protein